MSDKLVIIGFPKCGQHTLNSYLTLKGYHVETNEVILLENGYDRLKPKQKEMRPVIITRDPVARCWSWYHFNARNPKKPHSWFDGSYEEYLKYDHNDKYLGELNPIKQSEYAKWIEPWKKYDPLIFDMDILKNDPSFRHVYATPNLPEMPKKYKELTEKLLNELRI